MSRMINARTASVIALVAGTVLLWPSVDAVALQNARDQGESVAALNCGHGRSPAPEAHPTDISVLAARVEVLSRQVEELSRLVESLQARRSSGDGTAGALAPAAETALQQRSVSSRPARAGGLPLEGLHAAGSEDEIAKAAGAAQPEQASAETASKVLVGPFRLGGDFRLRLDGIVRPAYDSAVPGQPSLPHVQNVRGRYRFRLNIDTDLNAYVSFHGQLATGPVNNPLTLDQDFAATVARHPFMVNEAWADFHPRQGIVLQGGRVQEVFADNLRFLFDDDLALNGFNQRFAHDFKRPVAGIKRIEWRSGQYILSNPDVAIVTPGNLGPTGAVIGSTGRAAQLFHQGLLLDQGLSPGITQLFGADIQVYRNPNQIQFASTAAGVPIIVQNALGITLSGPVKGTGNATTTPGGSIYTAPGFQVARLTYRFDLAGLKSARQDYPLTVNFQVARNVGTGVPERDALLANFKIGRVRGRWDHSFLYMFAVKGANSMISQLTDDDLGTLSGVNIRSHFFRFDIGIAKGIQIQNLFFMQNQLRNSGQYPGFFVPLSAYAPRQYRFQEQIVFSF
jgi:hypothetical protein